MPASLFMVWRNYLFFLFYIGKKCLKKSEVDSYAIKLI